MSRRLTSVVFVAVTMLLLLSLPSSAMAKYWFVRDKAGHRQGIVQTDTNQYGTPEGLVWTWPSPSAVIAGTVFRLTEDGFSGWVVQATSVGTTRWVALITKISSTRYRFENNRGLAQRTDAGYWVVKKRVNGVYRRIGTVQKGCPGSYALGAARLLIWH